MSLDISLWYSGKEVFGYNITHNLIVMADKSRCFHILWTPEELYITTAGELIPLLRMALIELKTNGEELKQLNSPNGWGTYQNLLDCVEQYLQACLKHPNASIEISR